MFILWAGPSRTKPTSPKRLHSMLKFSGMICFLVVLSGCFDRRTTSNLNKYYQEYEKLNSRCMESRKRYYVYDDDGRLIENGKERIDLRGTWTEVIAYKFVEYDTLGKKLISVKQKENGKKTTKEWGTTKKWKNPKSKRMFRKW